MTKWSAEIVYRDVDHLEGFEKRHEVDIQSLMYNCLPKLILSNGLVLSCSMNTRRVSSCGQDFLNCRGATERH